MKLEIEEWNELERGVGKKKGEEYSERIVKRKVVPLFKELNTEM
jgi:hypothetical protein